MSGRTTIPGTLDTSDWLQSAAVNALPGGALCRWATTDSVTVTSGQTLDLLTTGPFYVPGTRLYGINVHCGRFDMIAGSLPGAAHTDGGATLVKMGVRNSTPSSPFWVGTIINAQKLVNGDGGADIRYNGCDGWLWDTPNTGIVNYRFTVYNDEGELNVVADGGDPGPITLTVFDFGPRF